MTDTPSTDEAPVNDDGKRAHEDNDESFDAGDAGSVPPTEDAEVERLQQEAEDQLAAAGWPV